MLADIATVRTSARRWRIAFLALLLLLGVSETTHATLGIYLRAAAVSWDSPITQHHDELASQSLPWADSFAESLARTRAAAEVAGTLGTLPAAPERGDLALSSRITRSPPTA